MEAFMQYPFFDAIYNDTPIPDPDELTLIDANNDVRCTAMRLVHYYSLMEKEGKSINPECDAILTALRDVYLNESNTASVHDHYKALYNALIRPEFSFIFDGAIKQAAAACKKGTLVNQNEAQILKGMVGDILQAKPLRAKDLDDPIDVAGVVRTMLLALLRISAFMHRIDCKWYQLSAAESIPLINTLKREDRKQPSEAIKSVVTLLEPIMKEILILTAPSNTVNRFAAIHRLGELNQQLLEGVKHVKPLEKGRRATAEATYKLFSKLIITPE